MKKRFLLLLCALLALPVFASAEDVLTLSGAALNAAQTNSRRRQPHHHRNDHRRGGNVRHRAVPPLKRPSSGGLYLAG